MIRSQLEHLLESGLGSGVVPAGKRGRCLVKDA
jgi:hypothetical protein